MSLNKIEFETFNHVFETVLNPIIEEYKEDIDKMVGENVEFDKRIEDKLEKILKNRKLKKATQSISLTQEQESN